MADPNTHINYSVEDIERYLSGGMSAKEMHDIEKAALQDPFLADAIEGYGEASMQKSHEHLNEITALLQKDKEDAKVVVMPTKSFQWWRVAAMIIVIAGVGMFSWYLIGMNKSAVSENNVAVIKNNSEPLVKDSNNYVHTDTTTALIAQQQIKADALKEAEPKELKEAKKVYALKKKRKTENIAVIKNADAEILADTSKSFALVSPVLEMDKRKPDTLSAKVFSPMADRGLASTSNNELMNQFSGIVQDINKQPVPGAIINVNNKTTAYTDNNGFFKIYAPDSTLDVVVSSVGYTSKNTKLQSGFSNKIAIKPNKESLSEVVITGYNSRKKISGTEYKYSNNPDTTFPAGGWESFQKYIYKQMDLPYDSTTRPDVVMHGTLEVEFSIDEDGDPYNFKILHSSGPENDAKAVKAIQDGPRWISSRKNKKGKVTVRF